MTQRGCNAYAAAPVKRRPGLFAISSLSTVRGNVRDESADSRDAKNLWNPWNQSNPWNLWNLWNPWNLYSDFLFATGPKIHAMRMLRR